MRNYQTPLTILCVGNGLQCLHSPTIPNLLIIKMNGPAFREETTSFVSIIPFCLGRRIKWKAFVGIIPVLVERQLGKQYSKPLGNLGSVIKLRAAPNCLDAIYFLQHCFVPTYCTSFDHTITTLAKWQELSTIFQQSVYFQSDHR